MLHTEGIESPQVMEVHVSGPEGANRLYIHSGIALFRWLNDSRDEWQGWLREQLRISMLAIPGTPRILEGQVIQHVESAALGSFSFTEISKRDTWGYAVDATGAFFTSDPDISFWDYGMTVDLAMRGFKVRMFRVSFQMHVLARV